MGELKLNPLADRVIVEPLKEEEITAGGIMLPETAREKSQMGTVLAVGPGAWTIPPGIVTPVGVVVGDVVLYAKYGGTEVKLGGRALLILSEGDILATVG